MKKLLVLLLGVLLSVNYSANAQDIKKGKEILGKVSKKYKSFKSIKADFKYVLEMQAAKMKEEQKGTFFMKDKKFSLDLGNQIVTCDGKTVWTYQKEANEVQVSKYDPKSAGFNPAEVFTMYEKGYLYAYTGDEGMYQVVELTPTDKTKKIFKVKLFIDKIKNTIFKSKVFEKSGNIYTWEILTLTPNSDMADNFFVFDKTKYPKVSIIDMQ